MATETVWTGIDAGSASGAASGAFQACHLNTDCPSACCVGQPICETCSAGFAVCVPAALCQ
jgi:hypothetical protein